VAPFLSEEGIFRFVEEQRPFWITFTSLVPFSMISPWFQPTCLLLVHPAFRIISNCLLAALFMQLRLFRPQPSRIAIPISPSTFRRLFSEWHPPPHSFVLTPDALFLYSFQIFCRLWIIGKAIDFFAAKLFFSITPEVSQWLLFFFPGVLLRLSFNLFPPPALFSVTGQELE